MTAAAEGPVTFGYFFYRWKARLCGWRGSSSAQGIGRRVRTPAPMAYSEALSFFRRGALCAPAGGQRPPLRRKHPPLWRIRKHFRSFVGARCARPRAAKGRPYGGNGPGALVRQSQARLWNRIRPKFLHTQGPVARIEWQKATQILRAENPTPSQRGNPRNGGPGVSGPMGTKCPSAASPGDPLVSFPSLGKKLAARRRRNIPLRGTKPLYHRPLIRPLRGHLPPRGKAFGGDRPLIRLACARHLPLSPLSLRDISP